MESTTTTPETVPLFKRTWQCLRTEHGRNRYKSRNCLCDKVSKDSTGTNTARTKSKNTRPCPKVTEDDICSRKEHFICLYTNTPVTGTDVSEVDGRFNKKTCLKGEGKKGEEVRAKKTGVCLCELKQARVKLVERKEQEATNTTTAVEGEGRSKKASDSVYKNTTVANNVALKVNRATVKYNAGPDGVLATTRKGVVPYKIGARFKRNPALFPWQFDKYNPTTEPEELRHPPVKKFVDRAIERWYRRTYHIFNYNRTDYFGLNRAVERRRQVLELYVRPKVEEEQGQRRKETRIQEATGATGEIEERSKNEDGDTSKTDKVDGSAENTATENNESLVRLFPLKDATGKEEGANETGKKEAATMTSEGRSKKKRVCLSDKHGRTNTTVKVDLLYKNARVCRGKGKSSAREDNERFKRRRFYFCALNDARGREVGKKEETGGKQQEEETTTTTMKVKVEGRFKKTRREGKGRGEALSKDRKMADGSVPDEIQVEEQEEVRNEETMNASIKVEVRPKRKRVCFCDRYDDTTAMKDGEDSLEGDRPSEGTRVCLCKDTRMTEPEGLCAPQEANEATNKTTMQIEGRPKRKRVCLCKTTTNTDDAEEDAKVTATPGGDWCSDLPILVLCQKGVVVTRRPSLFPWQKDKYHPRKISKDISPPQTRKFLHRAIERWTRLTTYHDFNYNRTDYFGFNKAVVKRRQVLESQGILFVQPKIDGERSERRHCNEYGNFKVFAKYPKDLTRSLLYESPWTYCCEKRHYCQGPRDCCSWDRQL